MSSKIIKNIDTEHNNFDYRLVRTKSDRLFEDNVIADLRIYEIWFSEEGEIIACTSSHESPFVDDTDKDGLEAMKYEILWYWTACKKPILDMDFIKDQIKRVKRRTKYRLRKEKNPKNMVEQCELAVQELKAQTISWDEMKADIDKREAERDNQLSDWEKIELLQLTIKKVLEKLQKEENKNILICSQILEEVIQDTLSDEND